jgi:hypothetical protein
MANVPVIIAVNKYDLLTTDNLVNATNNTLFYGRNRLATSSLTTVDVSAKTNTITTKTSLKRLLKPKQAISSTSSPSPAAVVVPTPPSSNGATILANSDSYFEDMDKLIHAKQAELIANNGQTSKDDLDQPQALSTADLVNIWKERIPRAGMFVG